MDDENFKESILGILENDDVRDVERIIFQIKDRKEIEAIILKSAGYSAVEIAEILGYKNVASFYQLDFRRRKNFTKLLTRIG